MKLFHCALTLKDPSSVTVKKGILKVDNINVQVTSTLRSLNWNIQMLHCHVFCLCYVSVLTIIYFKLFWRFKLTRVFFERRTPTGSKSLSLLVYIKTGQLVLPTSFQCPNYYSGGLPEKKRENYRTRMKIDNNWLTCVAQRLCLYTPYIIISLRRRRY